MLSTAKYLPGLALVLDTVIGDPRTPWHPVVLIGNLIAALEKRLLSPAAAPGAKRLAGFVLVLAVLAVSFAVSWAALAALAALHPLAGLGGGALLLAFAITPRSLAEAGREIQTLLEAGDLDEARRKVGWIVGRDTAGLDSAEITRATVETVAENITDGIIAPLFYAALGGAPLALLYRAVNTLDSMVGYKNDKYRDFGLAAARTDDAFNYIPARVTGVLVIAAAFLTGCDARGAARAIRRDAARHPSPNSGIPEAGVAGALGVRLGGLNYYGGVSSQRATMGDPRRPLAPGDIALTVRMMYTATALFAAIITVLIV
ncbi:adenosylcobinamide-phosphate synthase CbiB [Anaeroselena agilis]|uniref:Cobalamin biosynthesis protein CobD n=1 Tax=Anaeroselena agilis TaxID=3063788 RepID=A0ABU3NY62_9FIRM|nr:adenosylcobinamide-phosphate synthase CbiB [Selenomonadales bacterium 4137-cl]